MPKSNNPSEILSPEVFNISKVEKVYRAYQYGKVIRTQTALRVTIHLKDVGQIGKVILPARTVLGKLTPMKYSEQRQKSHSNLDWYDSEEAAVKAVRDEFMFEGKQAEVEGNRHHMDAEDYFSFAKMADDRLKSIQGKK